MSEPNKFKQMQDEMSRFEAEISGGDAPEPRSRAVISSHTYGHAQQRLSTPAIIPPPPPPPSLLQPMVRNMGMGPGPMMFGNVPPPPPPPSMLIPSQVRMRPLIGPDGNPMHMPFGPFMRPHAPPPLHKPQPAVLSSAPQLYNKPKKEESEKKKSSEGSSGKKSEAKSKVTSEVSEPVAPQPVVAAPQAAPAPAAQPAPHSDNPHPGKPGKKEKKNRKVIRTAGGQVWEDTTLLDWPDDDFRLFCGDLGNDVTDELLIRTFAKYGSFNRAKVVRDKRTNKSKGFGFISFKEPQDFIKAMKEMNGRYVGSRPIKLRKSTWRNRALDTVRKKEKEKAAMLALLTSGGKV